MNRLPTFIIIGAMKSGTTSLYHYLAAHPDVAMSREKESEFFLGNEKYARGLSGYLSLFAKAKGRALGEASQNHSERHICPDVPERMHNAVPAARLIYVVRDPIDRAISHNIHNYAKGRESRPKTRALAPDSNYVRVSPSILEDYSAAAAHTGGWTLEDRLELITKNVRRSGLFRCYHCRLKVCTLATLSDPIIDLGCNWAAFAEDIRAVGGFSPEFGAGSPTGATGQETALQSRLRSLGQPEWMWSMLTCGTTCPRTDVQKNGS